MANQPKPKPVDVEKVKAALVSAGIIKSSPLSKPDEAKLREQLARHHVDALRLQFQIICHSSHYCLVVRGIN